MKKNYYLYLFSSVIATCGGIGYFPYSPGTLGSLMGLFIYWYMASFPLWFVCSLFLTIFLCGVWSSTYLSSLRGIHDPSWIIIDELVGTWLALFLVPRTLFWYGVCFFLFRFFDITKIAGISQLERIHSGWGIMLDDLLAGLYTLIIIHILTRWLV